MIQLAVACTNPASMRPASASPPARPTPRSFSGRSRRRAIAGKHVHDTVAAAVLLFPRVFSRVLPSSLVRVLPVVLLSASVLPSSFVLPAIAAEAVDAKLAICGSCHGADGKPADSSVPIIWGQQQSYLEKQLRDYKSGERDSQIMSSMAEGLRNDEIAKAAASFAGRSWPRQHGGSESRPPDAAPACQTCHGEDFLGSAAAGTVAPRLAGQNQEYLADAMRSFASGERGNNLEMSALMKGMSADERGALARYLAGL